MSATIGSVYDINDFAYNDNEPGTIEKLQELNDFYRLHPWPSEHCVTTHTLRCADARDLSGLRNESIHLIVTSPPYWTLKDYPPNGRQLGAVEDYEKFLNELDKVWSECVRVLVPGGRICCVVGDVRLPRKKAGRHHVMPLHADITVRVRRLGSIPTPILWFKIANGALEAEGNGAGFYGKPYQPGAILVKNDFEYILFFRKGGAYEIPIH